MHRILYSRLVPACHRQVVVRPLGKEQLMNIDIADIKCYSAAAQVQVPHADKFNTLIGSYLVTDLLEIVIPAAERTIIMTAQAFDIENLEIAIISQFRDFIYCRLV